MSNCPIVPVICARRCYRYIFEHPRILYLALFVIIIFPVSFPIWACASVNLNINMAANAVQEAREEERISCLQDLYLSLCSRLKGFFIARHTFNDKQCLILTHEKLFDHPPFGPTSRVRIIIKGNDLEYMVHVLLREIQRGILTSDHLENQVLQLCSKFSLDSPIFRFCSGIDPSEYEQIKEVICLDIKGVHKTHESFLRVDSVNCLLWFELPAKCRMEVREAKEGVICPACVRLKCDLQHQANRTAAESPSKKIACQQSSSRAPLSHMSPSSQAKRRTNQQNDRKNLKKRLLRYTKTEVSLDDEQSDEVSSITSYLESNHSEELEKLFAEGICIYSLVLIEYKYTCR